MLGYGLGDTLVRQPLHFECGFRLGEVGALLQNAWADELDVDAHFVHVAQAYGIVGHATHELVGQSLWSATCSFFSHGLRKLGFGIGEIEHFRHDDVGVCVDDDGLAGGWHGLALQAASCNGLRTYFTMTWYGKCPGSDICSEPGSTRKQI